MLHVLSRLPRKLQDPHLVHTASRTRLLIFRPHHASRLRHHPAPLALPQPRGAPRLLVVQIAPALLRLCRASGRAVSLLDFSSFGRTRIYCAYAMHLDAPSHCSTSRRSPRAGSSSTTSPPSRVRVPRHVARLVMRLVTLLVVDYSASHRLVVDHFASVARPGASARRAAHHVARRRLLHLAQARRRLLRLHRASGCLSTSRGSSRCSSSTTLPPSRVRVPRHVARLVTPLVVDYSTSRRLVVDNSASRRLVTDNSASRRLAVDYFASTARLGASARRAARRRLLRLRRASGCLGTSCDSSFVVDYFAYATRPAASARHAARRMARCAACRRLLRLRRASGCLGTSHGPSHGSSSTTSCAATSSCGHAGSTSATPCMVTTCLAATLALLRVCCAPPRRRLPVASRRPFILTSFPN
jgi:hypothetical protein